MHKISHEVIYAIKTTLVFASSPLLLHVHAYTKSIPQQCVMTTLLMHEFENPWGSQLLLAAADSGGHCKQFKLS